MCAFLVCVCANDDLNDENNKIHTRARAAVYSIWKFNSVGLLISEILLYSARVVRRTLNDIYI